MGYVAGQRCSEFLSTEEWRELLCLEFPLVLSFEGWDVFSPSPVTCLGQYLGQWCSLHVLGKDYLSSSLPDQQLYVAAGSLCDLLS